MVQEFGQTFIAKYIAFVKVIYIYLNYKLFSNSLL